MTSHSTNSSVTNDLKINWAKSKVAMAILIKSNIEIERSDRVLVSKVIFLKITIKEILE